MNSSTGSSKAPRSVSRSRVDRRGPERLHSEAALAVGGDDATTVARQVPAPRIGTQVSLLPDRVSPQPSVGTLIGWDLSPDGTTVLATVELAEHSAQLEGSRVWAHVPITERGDYAILEAVAHGLPSSAGATVQLAGVLPVAAERRRGAVRAPAHCTVRVSYREECLTVRTVDLSRGGCRLLVPADQPAEPLTGHRAGSGLLFHLELDDLPDEVTYDVDTRAVLCAGYVLRAGDGVPDGDHLAVRFDGLAELDAHRIDRFVFSVLRRARNETDHHAES